MYLTIIISIGFSIFLTSKSLIYSIIAYYICLFYNILKNNLFIYSK